LSGNFHANLDAVLKDMGIFDKLAYRTEPTPVLAYPDRRQVVFRPNDNVPREMFDAIIDSIKVRIGFEDPWWGRHFQQIKHGITEDLLRCAQTQAASTRTRRSAAASRSSLKTIGLTQSNPSPPRPAP
jgi:hypothetical protein